MTSNDRQAEEQPPPHNEVPLDRLRSYLTAQHWVGSDLPNGLQIFIMGPADDSIEIILPSSIAGPSAAARVAGAMRTLSAFEGRPSTEIIADIFAVVGGKTVATSALQQQATYHAIQLEQCSLFVDSSPLASSMTDAAKFLRLLASDSAQRPFPGPTDRTTN